MEKVKNLFVTVLLVLTGITASMGFVACGKSETPPPSVVGISVKAEIAEAYVDEFDYSNYSIIVAYNNGFTNNVALTSGYLSSDDQAKITTVGTHTLTVNYLEKTTTFSVTLKNHEFSDVEFNDKAVTYNGLPQTIEIENLPDGATVTYSPQNSYTEVGEYEVTATIAKEYYNDLTLTATLKITDIMRKVTFVQAGFADVVKEVADGDGLKTEDIPEPQKVNGYDVKWDRSDFSKITSDLTVGIVKTPKTCTITYVLNGGTNHRDNPEEFTIESPTLALYNPEKAIGATFAGWYTSSAFTDESKITEIKSGSYNNLTLYAKWLDYRIENADGFSIDYNQQPALVSLTVPYTTENIDLNSRFMVSKGCTWKLYSDFTGAYEYPLKAMNLATGENKAYIIVFHPDGEHFTRYLLNIYRLDMKSYAFMDGLTVWKEDKIQERSELSAPESNPSKTGYDFSGWAIFDSESESIIEFPYRVYNDVVFKAVYTPIKYDIVYNLNGGTLDTQRLKYTIEESFVLDNPTRDYYDFSGWYDNAEFSGYPISGVCLGTYGKITLYAKWTPTVYDITYELNDGKNSEDNPDTYNVESEKITFAAPAKKGYTFVGWFTESTFKTQVSAIEKGSHGNVKLYAKWQENVNGLNFDGNGHTGGNTAPIQLKTTETVNLPQNGFVRAGYTFKGWSTMKDGYVRYNDKALYTMGTNSEYTLYAVWEANLNTLKFDGNGATDGTTSAMQIYTDASRKLNANGFTRNKYLFAGWSTTADGEVEYLDNAYYTMGTDGEYTLYAVWTLNENEISFDGNGATSGKMQNQTIYNNGTKVLTNNGFIKLGYRFIGWAESASGEVAYADGAEATFVQKENYTLYAKWEANENTLKFDGNGATSGATAPMTIRFDATTELTNNGFIKLGYHFIGWAESANGDVKYTDGATYTMGLNSSYTLYAKWEANENTLKFDGNGNTSGSMTAIVLKTNETKVIPSNAFVKAGYTFKGWATSANGEVVYNDGATYTMGTDSEYTLYAVWGANLNTLKFDGNGAIGGATEQMQIKTDETATLNANGFTAKTSYLFDGWATSANGAVVYADGASYTMGTDSEYTLYAVWTPIVYKITYVLDGGSNSEGNPSSITCLDSLPITLSRAYKSGYTFGGWYLNSDFSGSAITVLSELEETTLYAMWVDGSEGLTYSLSNSKYTVKGYTGTDTVVVIPSVYSGYPVTSIAYDAFRDCRSLTSITIPNNVTYIGSDAFENCSSLTSITIPNSVTSIGSYAFENCSSLNEVNYTGTIDQWVQIKFSSSYSNPLYYANNLYIDNKLVTEVNITTATKINEYVFYNCNSLTSITIPNGVTSIGSCAFDSCSSLTSVTIPNSVTSIGGYAFYGCSSLTSVTIPNSVTSIGNYAFYNCSSLNEVNYTGTIDQWVQIKFSSSYSNPLYYANNLYIDNKLVTEVNITTATKINEYVFYNCNSLTSITIPNGVTSIGSCAFDSCSSLTSVTIPNSVTSIGGYAFYGCSSLTSITIPNSVTSIGEETFYNCSSLRHSAPYPQSF